MTDFFLVAKVQSVVDKNGFLKIELFTDFPERVNKLSKIFVDFFGDKKELFVEKVRFNKNFWSIKIKNFNSEEECSFLLGKEIFVDADNLITLPENTYFVHDLIGSEVFRNGNSLGKIVDVLSTPANDVYVIQNSKSEELLIPALISLIENFDKENKVMILKPGEDLWDDED